ncbi:hypothetical protein [Acinetobacter sp. MD2(2019)]|uniref:hypothetical protein n=1 Tax=Acinetobacter sp. MD2(2019) TaxID=2605273 RepID=UPI002D1E4D12|nr:hypothetical protein [Acinetobacter sp. MD2(2019)]MEB3754479.1 hypothetical protein [Acinetobacter sp. MD2(2019)]
MSEAIIERLIQFAESGNQQRIQLHGHVHQGWIMEIGEDAFLISTGYNDKQGKDLWIPFNDLSHAELSFWDIQQDQWQSFSL